MFSQHTSGGGAHVQTLPDNPSGPSPAGQSRRTSEGEGVVGDTHALNPADLQDWFEAKNKFRMAAYRMLSQTALKTETDSEEFVQMDDALRLEHTDAGIAFLVVTLRLLHHSGMKGDIPFEDYSTVPMDSIPALELALDLNQDQLKLQSDAVGMIIGYLQGERMILQEKHASFMSNPSLH